jgi:hypothetical protein
VAQNFDKLTPERQWALSSAAMIRQSDAHIKYTRSSVEAAYREVVDRGLTPKVPMPDKWLFNADYGQYTVAVNAQV